MFRTSARLSLLGYQHYDAELALPRLANNHLFLNLLATHRNYPRMPYYGQGPDSSLLNRTNFRLKDSTGELTAGVRPFRALRIGATGGYMLVNTGAGTDPRHGFNSRAFVPVAAPGFARESRFITSGGFVHIEATDHPYSPKTGADYRLRFSNFVDQTPGRASFRQLDVDLRHYISFFQKQRSIVLRGYSVLTDTRRGQTVPFYLRPSLGGPETLRGFRPFRFYDNNLVLLTAEYRWKVSSGAELAFFGDGGKVFPRWREINLRDIEASYGAGIRFNVRQDIFFRCDVGVSHEGVQVWLRFHNLF